MAVELSHFLSVDQMEHKYDATVKGPRNGKKRKGCAIKNVNVPTMGRTVMGV